jgi:MFS family permease|tara:strand:- start:36766 stop:38022 length:1257 start_codon:yes stop_codon:yes gene_type:complete
MQARSFHYGWVIVANGFFLEMVVMGAALYSYSVFVMPFSRAFGVGTFEAMLGLTALNIAVAVLSPLAGHLISRGSPKRYMIFGISMLGAGFLLVGVSESMWWVCAMYASFIGLGYALVAPIAASALITNWFDELRGRALSIAAMGTSFGGLIIPPFVAFTIVQYDWRVAFMLLAGLFFLVSLPLVLAMVVDRPGDAGLRPYGMRQLPGSEDDSLSTGDDTVPSLSMLLKNLLFWRLGISLGIGFAVFMAVTANIVPYATTLGFTEAQGAMFLAGITACALLGKVVFALVTDRIGIRNTFLCALLLNILAMLMLLGLPYFYTLFIAVVCVGLSSGGLLVSWPGFIALHFGKQALAKVMGASAPLVNGCMMLFPPFAGKVFDVSGDYRPAFAAFLFLLLVGVLLTLGLNRPARTVLLGPR